MSTMQPPDPLATTEAQEETAQDEAAQAEVAGLRQRLLDGRGPGVGHLEFLSHTRGRVTIAGMPVPFLREGVALDAAAARKDPDALALAVVGQRSRVAGDLDQVLSRLSPRPASAGSRRRRRRPPSAWLGVGLLAAWLVGRRLRRTR